MIKPISLLLFSLFLVLHAKEFTPKSVELGVPFSCTLLVDKDSRFSYTLAAHEKWKSSTEIHSITLDTTQKQLKVIATVSAYLTPTCTLSLPTLTKTPKDSSNKKLKPGEDTLPPVLVSVATLFTDSTDSVVSAEYHPPMKAGKYPWHLWLIALAVLLLIVGIILLVRRYLNRDKAPKAIEEPFIHPYDEALKALAQLSAENLLMSRRIKEYVFRLSEILKRYLGRTYEAPFQESTAQEFMAWITQSSLNRENRVLLERFIDATEPIKFADAEAESTLLRSLFDDVRSCIEITHRTEQTKETQGARA